MSYHVAAKEQLRIYRWNFDIHIYSMVPVARVPLEG